MFKIKIRNNRDDEEMLDIYSDDGKFILWGVVHIDMLSVVDCDYDLDDGIELTLKIEG